MTSNRLALKVSFEGVAKLFVGTCVGIFIKTKKYNHYKTAT